MSLVLARVDDRLVHGQVVLAWGRHLHTQRYLVVDDALAASDFERQLVAHSAGGVPVTVATLEEGARAVLDEAGHAGAAVLLVRSPVTALELVRRVTLLGGRLAQLNLGGLHYAPGKEKALDYIYLDDADRDALEGLVRAGVRVYAQDVPAAPPLEMPVSWTRRGA